ncbi:biliverdin-producing heme oxygenase [Mucilaginibacter sp. S1162]|uniref:Biliverdin-producing heme oxygenase n=1 Tax=Mucilaginibacter humi TaxID=2732510 RepID=A0ABX1W0Q7_9SPHI|nr:biliverdin-producing heme oxygenase [Mucilaginibacter humi]NNU33797.1 biliverdin-producing heme oxygenase [Mucilaginibacter humi]
MPTNNELPQITNYLQGFGALYVIEGSTLGGQIISKMVQQHLPVQDGKGLSFFNGYGDKMHQMWGAFKDILNKAAATPEDEQIIIAAANDTFAKFKTLARK